MTHKIFLLWLFLLTSILRASDCGKLSKLAETDADFLSRAISDFETSISHGTMMHRWDPELRTSLYFSAAEPGKNGEMPLVDPKSKAVVIFFHGSGTMKSSGKNFRDIMSTMKAAGVSTIGVDMPFHGDHKGDKTFNEMNVFMKWIRKVVDQAKASGKPVYLAGHSFGPSVAQEFAGRHPKDINGIILLSPAPSQHPALKWTYENITDPGMAFIGGDAAAVEENVAGGEWAGRMGEQETWHERKLPSSVKVTVLLGEKDEWWPGNTELARKVGKEQKYKMSEPLAWFRGIYPHADFRLLKDTGHYLFDAKTANGRNAINEAIFDTIGVPETRRYPSEKTVSKREELRTLANHSPSFRDWLGGRLKHATTTEDRAEREMRQWAIHQRDRYKQFLENLSESMPEFYARRRYSIDRALANLPANQTVKVVDWMGPDLKLFSEVKNRLRARAEGKRPPPLDADPATPVLNFDPKTNPAKPAADPNSIWLSATSAGLAEKGRGSVVETVPVSDHIQEVTYEMGGRTAKRRVLSGYSPEEFSDMMHRQYLKAWESNDYKNPGDEWTAYIDGVPAKVRMQNGRVSGIQLFDGS